MLQKLADLINNTMSGSNDVRIQAEKSIQEFSKSNLSEFLSYLAEIISSKDFTVYTRQLSLILISNEITAKNQFETQAKIEAWLHLDFDLRNKVKSAAISCLLQKENNIISSGASLFSKITKIELASKTFKPDIIDSLVTNTQSNDSNLITSSLLQLEYIVEEAEELLPEDQCNKITECCLSLIHKLEESIDPEVLLIKTKAFATLTKALPFSSSYIVANIAAVISVSLKQLQLVYTIKDNEELIFEFNSYISVVFECLISYIEIYSDCLTSVLRLIRPILETTGCYLSITYHAFDTWSCLFENFFIYIYKQNNQDHPVEIVKFRKETNTYIDKCIESVVTGLEYYDEDAAMEEEFNDNYYGIKQAASVCFDKINEIFKKKMFEVIGNYVNKNFKLGSEISKLESSAISIGLLVKNQHVKYVLEWGKLQAPVLFDILSKHNEILSEAQNRKNLIKTTLWCFQKLVIHAPDVITQTNLIGHLLQQCILILNYKLNTTNEHVNSSIINNSCVLLLNILEAMKKLSIVYVIDDEVSLKVLEMLIKISESMNVDDAILVESSFNTMIALISCTPGNKRYSSQLAQYLLNRCANILQNANSITESNSLSSGTCYSNISSCLATFQTMLLSDETKEIMPFVPPFVELIHGLLSSSDTGLYEEAFFSIGTVLRYYQNDDSAIAEIANKFHSNIIVSISNHEELQNCKAAIVTLGDLSHALGLQFNTISDQCVSGLMKLLLSNDVDSSVKPVAIECLADLCMVLEDNFEKYIPHLTPIIVDASKANLTNSAITEDFFELLSISVLETTAAFLHNSCTFMNSAITIAGNYLQCDQLNYVVIGKLILLLKIISETMTYSHTEFNLHYSITRLGDIIGFAREKYGKNTDIKEKFEELQHGCSYI